MTAFVAATIHVNKETGFRHKVFTDSEPWAAINIGHEANATIFVDDVEALNGLIRACEKAREELLDASLAAE